MRYRFCSPKEEFYDRGLLKAVVDENRGEYVWMGVKEEGEYKTVIYRSNSTDTEIRCSRKIGGSFRYLVVTGYQREGVEKQLEKFKIGFDKKQVMKTGN